HDRQSSFLVIDRSPSCLFILPLLAALPIFSSLWLSWACLGGLLRQSLAVASMDFAIRSLRSAVASFYPRTLPPMLRANYGRELLDRKSTRLNSSHVKISYAVFCFKKKKNCI